LFTNVIIAKILDMSKAQCIELSNASGKANGYSIAPHREGPIGTLNLVIM
jgi:hypothetical protein